MRNIKVLGLALTAVLAMSAFAAATASANEFNSESYPTTGTGTKDGEFLDVLTLTAGTVKCTTPTYKATLSAKSTSVSVAPSYAGCTGFGFPGEVVTTGCVYVFNIGAGATTEGDVDLECTGANEITIISKSGATVKCTVHVKSQTDIGGTVKYINISAGATREITVEANLTGIDYTHTAGTGIGACTSGSSTTGTLTAKGVATGENAGGTHVGVFLTTA